MWEERYKMRILQLSLLIPALLTFSGVFAGVSDLDVAKKALRDNLWEIARIRAANAEGDEAKVIILESYAHEGKWKEILSQLDSWGNVPSTDPFVFYRTLAEARLNGSSSLVDVLSNFKFADNSFARSLAALFVQMSLRDGDVAGAKKIVENFALYSADDDSKVVSAEVYNIAGDRSRAVSLWSETVSSTNAGETAFAMGALEKIEVEEGNEAVKVVDGALVSQGKNPFGKRLYGDAAWGDYRVDATLEFLDGRPNGGGADR